MILSIKIIANIFKRIFVSISLVIFQWIIIFFCYGLWGLHERAWEHKFIRDYVAPDNKIMLFMLTLFTVFYCVGYELTAKNQWKREAITFGYCLFGVAAALIFKLYDNREYESILLRISLLITPLAIILSRKL